MSERSGGHAGSGRRFQSTTAPVWALALPALLAAVFGAAAAVPAAAGSGQWTSIGPPRGIFDELVGASDAPGTVYASNRLGDLWNSTDGGVTWSFVSRIAGDGLLVTVNPGHATTVYAGTRVADFGSSGVYRSADGGVTWQHVLVGFACSSVVISPAAPQIAYVCLDDGSIQRSDDAGLTWRPVGALPQSYTFGGFALAIDPTDPNTLYDAGQPGVLKSTDGGANWSQVFSFSNPMPENEPIALFVAPSNPATLLLANNPLGDASVTPDARVLRSDDAGATWTAIDAGLPGLPQKLLSLAVGVSGTVYAAVGDLSNPASQTQIYQEVGTGAGWRQTATLPYGQGTLEVDSARPERVYALGNAGVLRSADGGLHFAVPARAPSSAIVNQVLIGPGAPGSLYVAASDGDGNPGVSTFNDSPDGGATWTASFPPFQTTFGGTKYIPTSLSLTLDAQPGTLYSLAFPSVEPPGFVSHDDGATWQILPLPPFAEQPLSLAADPHRPGRLAEVGCRYVDVPFRPLAVFEPVCTALRLYTTNTAGRHWNRIANLKLATGFVEGGGIPTGFGDLRLDPVVPTTIYVLAGVLYKSTAAHPQLARLPLPGGVADLVIDPSHTATLYAAAAGLRRPVFKSSDGGATWTNSSAGLPRGVVIAALAIDPSAPSTLYASTDQGLFVTEDGAATWQPVNSQGLPLGVPLTKVAVSPATSPPTLYLGTLGAGVFALTPAQ
jgi:photosystem II stability/assembly factor-like uncharacterized protein